MSKTRLASVAGVVMVVLALTAAVFNYLNNGRITLKAVGGVLFFVSMALAIRAVTASGERGRERESKPKTS